jgi:hypothetical protein
MLLRKKHFVSQNFRVREMNYRPLDNISIKNSVFLDVATCRFITNDVSEEPIASIFRRARKIVRRLLTDWLQLGEHCRHRMRTFNYYYYMNSEIRTKNINMYVKICNRLENMCCWYHPQSPENYVAISLHEISLSEHKVKKNQKISNYVYARTPCCLQCRYEDKDYLKFSHL